MKGKTMKKKALPHLAAGLAVAALLGTADLSHANVVLHDTTWMTDDQTYDNSLDSYINNAHDINVADDFVVSNGPGYHITSVTGDFHAEFEWGGDGVLVEFFSDEGGTPGNTPTASFLATEDSGLTVSSFDNPNLSGFGMRFTIDLSATGLTLGAGSWWLSIVPVDQTGPAQPYRWIRQKNYQEGGEIHVRNGGEAHGNGLGGSWGTYEWAPYTSFGPDFLFPPGDMAMSVEGTPIVPAPAAIALLWVGGFGLCSRRRAG